jgi:polysaccharide deacetylase family protein (PEP-CTERM system associated)
MPDRTEAPVCFTVDLEDWHHGIEIPMREWGRYERRLEVGLMPLLDLLSQHETRATFFTLGWVAREYPQLVREIAGRGHELASHGFSHEKVYNLSPEAFREEVRETKARVEDAGGGEVTAYRAPFFSITSECLWALDILGEEGYRIDCSISPVRTWRYGIAGCPDALFRIGGSGLVEFPVSSMTILGRKWGVGGAYFRLAPYEVTRRGIRRRLGEGRPTMFYIHPWELDPEHPRMPLERRARLTHYTRLGVTRGHLAKLLGDFQFETVGAMVAAAGPTLREIKLETLED